MQGFGSVPFFSVLTGPDLGFCFLGGGDRIEEDIGWIPLLSLFSCTVLDFLGVILGREPKIKGVRGESWNFQSAHKNLDFFFNQG